MFPGQGHLVEPPSLAWEKWEEVSQRVVAVLRALAREHRRTWTTQTHGTQSTPRPRTGVFHSSDKSFLTVRKKKKKSPGPGVRRKGNNLGVLRALRAMEQSHSTAISCYDNH